MCYRLYHDEKTLELLIKTDKNSFRNKHHEVSPNVFYFNDYCFVSEDRKALRVFAKELRDKWIKEAEERLRKLKQLNIKVIY